MMLSLVKFLAPQNYSSELLRIL